MKTAMAKQTVKKTAKKTLEETARETVKKTVKKTAKKTEKKTAAETAKETAKEAANETIMAKETATKTAKLQKQHQQKKQQKQQQPQQQQIPQPVQCHIDMAWIQRHRDALAELPSECIPQAVRHGEHSFTLTSGDVKIEVLLRRRAFRVKSVAQGRTWESGPNVAWQRCGSVVATWAWLKEGTGFITCSV